MGMTCSLHRATEAEIESLLDDPDAVQSFLGFNEGLQLKEVKPKGFGLVGLIFRLFPIKEYEVVSDPAVESKSQDRERVLDIEKAWHGLHFLFTGTTDEGEEPACFLLQGGAELDDEGVARALGPADVRRFADYLATLSPAELERRYDPALMTRLEIYPEEIWQRPAPPGDAPLDWLRESFGELKQFIARAAAAGDGVIVHVG